MLLNKDFDKIITESLFNSIIITYGKCFTDATTSKSPKLEIRDCFDETNIGLKIIHDKLMVMRHNFIAHRGETEHDVGVAYLRLCTVDLSLQVGVKRNKRYSLKKNDLDNYIILFEHLKEKVKLKIEKEAHKVWKHMRNNYKPEYFSQLILGKPKEEVK